jgi:hypothetical protein
VKVGVGYFLKKADNVFCVKESKCRCNYFTAHSLIFSTWKLSASFQVPET